MVPIWPNFLSHFTENHKLTVWMNGVWVEEGPRLSAAPVRSPLRVLTPDPIELLVQTNVNLVEQRGLEILVMGAIDSWKAGIRIGKFLV